MDDPEIKKSHASNPQEWKSLHEIVATVNCESRDKLVSFIHKTPLDTVEDRRKPFMLNILVPQRQLYLKLKTLVNWSEHADVIRNCESCHHAMRNQQQKINNVLHSLVDFRYGVIPHTSTRCPDITTAIDVLTTGRYQKFPRIIEEDFAPKIVTDKEVKEALKKINTYIELRILTEEVLPPEMKKYRVADGRITFHVDKEFEVVLTPNVAEENVFWVILDLKFLIQSENDKLCNDVDLTLHENQIERIKNFAHPLLIPPPIQQPVENSLQGKETTPNRTPKHLPLLKLYDYLHTLCLDAQLEVLFQQAFRLHKTRWSSNLMVELDPTHTTLRVCYWTWVKHTVQNAQIQQSRRPNVQQSAATKPPINHDVIEISIAEEIPSKSLIHSTRSKLSKSNWLNDASRVKPGVINDGRGLNYPRKFLRARWSGLTGELANKWSILDWEFDPANLNFEHLLLHVTQKHAESNIKGLKEKLCSTEILEKDVEIVEGHQEFPEDFLSEDSPISDEVAKKYLKVNKLRVWLSENRYVKVGVDIRSGRTVIEENNNSIEEEVIKISEDKLIFAPNPLNIVVEVFLMLKFMTMMAQIEKAARYLQFDVHRGVILRKDDVAKLGTKQLLYLRFPQYTDYFLICGIGERELRYWLTVLSREPPVSRYMYDKNVRDPTHKITSIQQIPLEDLIVSDQEKLNLVANIIDKGKSVMQEGEISEQKESMMISGKRNLGEVDVMEDSDSPRKRKPVHSAAEFEHEIILLSKISAVCRARISYRKMEELLKSHNLSFTTVQPNSSMEFLDSNTSISLNSAIPVLKLDRKQLLAKLPIDMDKATHVFGDIYVRYVGSRLVDSSMSSVIMLTCLKPDSLPIISNVISMGHIQYDLASQILSFKYSANDSYIEKFINDWNNIVTICQTASQVKKCIGNTSVKLVPFDLRTMKFHYTEDLFVEIEWNVSKYVLHFGISNSEKRRNPHQRICNYLQNALNIDCKVDSLIPILIKTAPLFSVLDELCERNDILVGGKFLSIIPRSFNHVRLIYSSRLTPFSAPEISSKYGLDIMVQNDDQTLISDASLASGVTKLQPLTLWDRLSKSVVVEKNNDSNSIPVERFISLTEGIVVPINDCKNILRWLDTQIRQHA